MADYLDNEKNYKFFIEIYVKDVFIKAEDLIEYLKFRLNLKECCKIEKLYLVEDSSNIIKIPKKENKKCVA